MLTVDMYLSVRQPDGGAHIFTMRRENAPAHPFKGERLNLGGLGQAFADRQGKVTRVVWWDTLDCVTLWLEAEFVMLEDDVYVAGEWLFLETEYPDG